MANGLKDSRAELSGRSSIVEGAKYARGFTIHPADILRLLHDTQPGFAIPSDAQYTGFHINQYEIGFHYESILAFPMHCFAIKPELLFRILVELCDGLLPRDSELNGIEKSDHWLPLMLRVSSSHWPPCPQDDKLLPMYHLRYEVDKVMHLYDPSKMMEGSKRIVIN